MLPETFFADLLKLLLHQCKEIKLQKLFDHLLGYSGTH